MTKRGVPRQGPGGAQIGPKPAGRVGQVAPVRRQPPRFRGCPCSFRSAGKPRPTPSQPHHHLLSAPRSVSQLAAGPPFRPPRFPNYRPICQDAERSGDCPVAGRCWASHGIARRGRKDYPPPTLAAPDWRRLAKRRESRAESAVSMPICLKLERGLTARRAAGAACPPFLASPPAAHPPATHRLSFSSRLLNQT